MAEETINSLFWKLILQNELSGNVNAALRFSNASSKSGLSFGVSQLDITHNDQAVACLRECGFTDSEIRLLQAKMCDWKAMSPRLAAHADIVERYDEAQLTYCLNKAVNFDTDFGIPVADTAAILAGADYCNQYGSEGNGARAYYKSLGRPITAKDVLDFKLNHTLYGKNEPEDCKRRYDNLLKIMAQSRS